MPLCVGVDLHIAEQMHVMAEVSFIESAKVLGCRGDHATEQGEAVQVRVLR